MENLEQLKEELEEKKGRLDVLNDNGNTEEYDEMLDESGPVEVAGMSFYPSRIIKELDPTAYNCGMNNWNDPAITELEEEIEALEEQIKEAEAEEK